ncbi:MFS general substrate transporter [Pleurotus eryngii]|uniref:MFS general substrate transporter n=1 Tax=Pleurotus eryngii TaxID=5323 RepID=A0A9P5ZWE6_PLEER|nr:MFS general substrate transporter [Pleurotus eryngii]
MTGFASLPIADEGAGHDDPTRQFGGVSKITGPRWAHLPTITIGLLGVQIFWSVEMSYASPYLLSLGLSKSNMAVVFLAGPLSGLIMQPIIGVLADNSTSRFGRRRPYMIGGSIVCACAMLLLGYTRPFASIFTGKDSDATDILTIWLAVLAIYLIDFSINAVQAVDRALLVDTLPSIEQPAGNAWAARMLGIGSVVGFFVGNIDLPSILPFLGSGQLQVLSAVGSFLLLATHGVTAMFVKERRLLSVSRVGLRQAKENRIVREIKDIFSNMLSLPSVIRQICIIQFFAWIGWFPILFYTTIYVGDLYKRAHSSSLPPSSSPEFPRAQADLDATATRLGSRALFYSSLLSLAANILLPFFVAEASNGSDEFNSRHVSGIRAKLLKLGALLTKKKVHLASLWAVSHLIFALCMFGTFFTGGVFGATVLMTITGFSWAVTQWAPFALLGEAILADSSTPDDAGSIRLTDTRTRELSGGSTSYRGDDTDAGERDGFLVVASDDGVKGGDSDNSDDEDNVLRQQDERRRAFILGGNGQAQVSRADISSGRGDDDDDEQEGRGLSAKAGIILGIHNVFIVIPQFLVTSLSSILFAIFDPQKSVLHGAHPGNIGNNTVAAVDIRDLTSQLFPREAEIQGGSNSVVYIFRIGGLSAAIACVLGWRLAREMGHR